MLAGHVPADRAWDCLSERMVRMAVSWPGCDEVEQSLRQVPREQAKAVLRYLSAEPAKTVYALNFLTKHSGVPNVE